VTSPGLLLKTKKTMTKPFFFALMTSAVVSSCPFYTSAQTNAPFTGVNVANLPQVYGGSVGVAWGDYDNDGQLDFVISGSASAGYTGSNITQLWHNDGNGNFHQVDFPGLGQFGRCTCVWIDYDNDGYLDLMIVGATNYDAEPGVQLWHNQGNGTFTNVPLPGVAGNSAQDTGTLSGGPSVAWGDYDNDGRPDFVIDLTTPGVDQSTMQLWHNDGNGNFSLVPTPQSIGYSGGIAPPLTFVWADMDNDGWLDLVVGQATNASGAVQPQILHNNAGNPLLPAFTVISPNTVVSDGSTLAPMVEVGDFNNDGLLDIVSLNSSGDNLVVNQNLGGNNFTPISTGANGISRGIWPAADFNNDGLLDLALFGAGTSFTSGVLQSDGGGTFTFEGFPGFSSANDMSLAWGDYDNDGRLDLLFTGVESGGATNRLWHNNTATSNTPPSAPTGLAAVAGPNDVQFSWNPATDAQTPSAGLSYNIRVGTSPGTANYVSPMADLATGWRRVPRRGPIQTTSCVLTNMPPGIYYWSVQAIDTAFAGGPFGAEGVVAVPGIGITPAYAANVTSNSAVLYSTGTPGGADTTAFFQWGLTTGYGNTILQDLGSGTVTVPFHQLLTGLQPATYYHFRAGVSNAAYALYTSDGLFYTDPNIIVGDLNGDGIIEATEVNGLVSNYFDNLGPVLITNPVVAGGGQFDFAISNLPAWSFNVQASSDLQTWTNLPTAAIPYYQFTDPQATNSSYRYYRLR
jgi:hypothetical protein